MQRLRLFNSFLPLLMLGIFLSGTAYGATPARHGAWRELARAARGSCRNGRYTEALSGYKAALAALLRENRSAEEQYDLELMIADVYRLDRRFVEAKQIFDRLEPVIKSGKYVDPLLACRFHSRRADLDFDLHRVDDALRDLTESIAVKEKYFYRDAGTLIRQYAYLLEKLRENGCWSLWHTTVKKWDKQIQQGSLPKEIAEEYKSGLDIMHREVLRHIADGSLDQSEKFLRLCRDIEFDHAKLLDYWGYHLYHCYAYRRPVEIGNALVDIQALLAYVESHPELNVPQWRLVSSHLGLMVVYLEEHQGDKAHKESESIDQLIREKPLDPGQKEWLTWDAKLRLPMIELRTDCPVTDEMIGKLKESTDHLFELSSMSGLSPDLEKRIRQSEVRGRMNLVVAFSCRGLVDEAERELSKLPACSKDPAKDPIPFYRNRLCGLYARLAKAELDHRDKKQARQLIQTARKLLPDQNQKHLPKDLRHKASMDVPVLPIIKLVEEQLNRSP